MPGFRGPYGLVVAAVIVIGATAAQAVANRSRAYRCDTCGATFSLSAVAAVASPRSMGRKLVTCPRCGKRDWATPVARES